MKYHFYVNVTNNDLKHAGTKAVNDCTYLLAKDGYKLIQLNFYKHRYLIAFNLIKLICQLLGLLFTIESDSLIVVQYPLFGLKGYFRFFINMLKLRNCIFVCVIHDLDSLRYQKQDQAVAHEIHNLNAYNVLISHNERMTAWLKSKGIKSKIINLEIFDYLFTNENKFNRLSSFTNGDRDVIIAGNLGRGSFIYQLENIAKKIQFKLYGPNLDLKRFGRPQHVSWEGVYAAEELVENLHGNFGLIWDGDEIAECTGQHGNYICYNNPHKISLYLAAGLPVILPFNAALSTFVVKNRIGFAVKSLSELNEIIEKMDVSQYELMINNILSIKCKLKSGLFFRTAIKQIESEYSRFQGTSV